MVGLIAAHDAYLLFRLSEGWSTVAGIAWLTTESVVLVDVMLRNLHGVTLTRPWCSWPVRQVTVTSARHGGALHTLAFLIDERENRSHQF